MGKSPSNVNGIHFQKVSDILSFGKVLVALILTLAN